MDKLLSFVIDSIPENATPKIIILFLFFASFLYALSQANVIYDFVKKINNRKLTKLKELVADENISETAKKTLQDKINLAVYQKITGLKINNIYLQEQIIQCYELAKGRLKYSDFQRAFTLLQIDSNDILTIRKPNIYEKFFYIYSIFLAICFFIFFAFFFIILGFFAISIKQQVAAFILVLFSGAMLFVFSYQASLIPCANRIKDELEKNPFIIQRNKAIIELRQTFLEDKQLKSNTVSISNKEKEVTFKTSTLSVHPLAHLSTEERHKRIKQVLGAWKDDPEIDAIFTEIDRERHNYHGRQIDSLDN